MSSDVLSLILRAKDEASASVAKVGKQLDGLGVSAEAAGKKGTFLNGVLAGLGAGVGVAGVVGVANAAERAVSMLGDMADAAKSDQISIQRLDVALTDNVKGWSGNTDAIEKAIASRVRLGFEDDTLRQSMGTLVTATGDVTASLRLQQLAMDLARFRGIDLSEATDAVAKAANGSTKALNSMVPATRGAADAQDALRIAIDAVSGSAEKYAGTDAGKIEAANARLSESLEKLGYVVLPLVGDAAAAAADKLDTLAMVTGDTSGSSGVLESAIGGVVGAMLPFLAITNDLEKKLKDEIAAADAVSAAVGDEQAATLLAGAAATTAAGSAAVYTGQLGRLASAAQVARDRLAALNGTMGASSTAASVSAATGFRLGQSYAEIQKSTNDAILGQRQWIQTTRASTTAMGGAAVATDRLKSAQQALASQYEALKTKAIAALDAIHTKKVRAIDDAMKLRQAEYDAYVAATQGPVDAARAALEEERAKRDLADAERDLAQARAEGDTAAIEAAQRRVDDLKADQRIAQMQKEADAAIEAKKKEKEEADKADEAAKKKADDEYAAAKKKIEDQIKWLEGHLDTVNATYKKRVTDLIGSLKKYGLDFETIGKTMGDKYASGVVKGLDSLIASIAKKVAALLEDDKAGGTTPPGRAVGGPVRRGRAYTVGESGVETFVPGEDGTIVPHGAALTMAGGGLSVGSITVNVSTRGGGFDAVSAVRDFYDQLDREGRRRGYVGIGTPA